MGSRAPVTMTLPKWDDLVTRVGLRMPITLADQTALVQEAFALRAALDAAEGRVSDTSRALEMLRAAVVEVALTIEGAGRNSTPWSISARWARVLRFAVAGGTP